MKTRSLLVGAGIAVSLFALFIFSVIVARLIIGDRTGILMGEGIGIVEVKGVIADSEDTVEQLHLFRDDRKIKAVVLRIDSPGGVVAPTQEIYEEVGKLAAKKKVVVSMGSVAASGGYYIAAPANMIFANPGTVTGSIGVLMQLSNIEGLLSKVGMKSHVLKSGKYKDAGSPVRELSKEDREVLQSVVDSMQGQFINAVAKGRKLPQDQVLRVADGRILSGEQALGWKLVDRLGNLQDAIAEAGRLAGIKGDPEIVYPPEKKRSWLDLVLESTIGSLAERVEDQGLSARYQLKRF